MLEWISCRRGVSSCFRVDILSTSGVFVFQGGHFVDVGYLCVLEWTSCRRRVSLCFRVGLDFLSALGVFVFFSGHLARNQQ